VAQGRVEVEHTGGIGRPRRALDARQAALDRWRRPTIRCVRGLRILAAVTVAALACAPAAAAHPGHANPFVLIHGFGFDPSGLTVVAGDSVVWLWEGPDRNHSVTSDPGQSMTFDSDPGKPAATIQHTAQDAFTQRFDVPGRYTYHCTVHPVMTGFVTVIDSGGPAVTPVAPQLSRLRVKATRARVELHWVLSDVADLQATFRRVAGGRATGRVVKEVDFGARAGSGVHRVSTKGLRPGHYRVRLLAVDRVSGVTGKALQADVTVPR
jgi:plastocyanin